MTDIVETIATLGFHVEPGTVIVTTAETSGETHEGREVTCPPGSVGVVNGVAKLSSGLAVIVRIDATQSPETGEDTHIVNVFEAGDAEPRFPFVRADAAVRELAAALKAAESCLAGTLSARGYAPGSCTDEWSPEVRLEVATLAKVRATTAKLP